MCNQLFSLTFYKKVFNYMSRKFYILLWRLRLIPQVETQIAVHVKKIQEKNEPVLLNIGCGKRFHSDWINIDMSGDGVTVYPYNFLHGLPLQNSSVDAIYLSHCLEHFNCEGAHFLLHECQRVLVPHGVIRIVVPDMEELARSYLKELDMCRSDPQSLSASERHRWMMIEMLDQLCRHYTGGEMLKFWAQEKVPSEEFVISRIGREYFDARSFLLKNKTVPLSPRLTPLRVGKFRLSGEPHQWMYDSCSLERLLRECRFEEVRRMDAFSSSIGGFIKYNLDTEPNGHQYKPNSLFMEAFSVEM
jgi:predicted SAM-dependent methyltransferase